MKWDKHTINKLEHRYRVNLINSLTGVKSANLIGTLSNDKKENLAIFNSVIHLGSSPPLLGFIMRPVENIPRNTYSNILSNGYYTINAIPYDMIENAHYTSAKFQPEESEFEKCNIAPHYIEGFNVPFVKNSPIQVGMKFVQEISIEVNSTILIIGSIETLQIQSKYIEGNGLVNLESCNGTGIGGVDSYYKLNQKKSFAYARPGNIPDLMNK